MTSFDGLAYDGETRSRLAQLDKLVECDGLPLDGPARRAVEQVLDLLDALRRAPPVAADHEREQRVRVATQLAAACRMAFDWRSPGYAQTGVLSVGDVSSLVEDLEALLDAPVNYARWNPPAISGVEQALGAQIGTVQGRDAVLATNSGLAALSVVLGLLRRLDRMGRVLVVPGTYFETHPTLELFGPEEIRRAGSREIDAITDEAAVWGADVVLADPLEHGPEQRVLDVEGLAAALHDRCARVALVVDGTMVPASGVFTRLRGMPGALRLYYESSAKYRHVGLDMTLGGAVVVPSRYREAALEVRQSLGAALDRFGCEVTPRPDPQLAMQRLRAMEQASVVIARIAHEQTGTAWRVVHPSLPSHPEAELAARLGIRGACVTFVPESRGAVAVLRFVKRAVDLARAANVEMVVGESLGFTACRLTPTVAAPGSRPYARLATGALAADEASALAGVLVQAMRGARTT